MTYEIMTEVTKVMERLNWVNNKFINTSLYAPFLVENDAKKGVDVNKLVLKEMTRSTNLNDDQAFEEVIAQSCESFLRDIHLSDKAEQLYKTDKGLATKIKNISTVF